MPRPNRQGFFPSNGFPSNTFDMLGVPLLYSHVLEESETGGGGGGSYGQPATPGGLRQNSYGTQVAGGGGEYVPYVPREHHRSSRGTRLPPDHGQDTFDFSALPMGQPIGYQQSQGAVGVYTPPGHGSREPQIYYTNDARKWNPSSPQGGDHSRPSTADHLVGQSGLYRRGGGRDVHQRLRPGQGPPPPGAFQLHGQRHIYTNRGRPGAYLPSPSHSAENISPIIKSDSPVSISLSWSSDESPRYQSMEQWLRENSCIPSPQPLNLSSLPDPKPGTRPIWTYKVLVSLAIWGSPTGRLSLQEIYSQIENRFEYYKDLPNEPGRDGKSGGKKWQRSVRHNLSLESIFHNEGRDISEPGKGGYWSLTNRNGYGQKRERKRKGKSLSRLSRDSFHKNINGDDDNDDDDDDVSHNDHPSSSRPRYWHSRRCSSYLGESSRPRHIISHTSSTPLPNMSKPDPCMYPTCPSTVPMYEDHSYDTSGGSSEEYLHQGQGQSDYNYGHMEGHLRGDKGKRRAS